MCEWVKPIICCACYQQNNSDRSLFKSVHISGCSSSVCFLALFPVIAVTQCNVCRLSCQPCIPNGTVPLIFLFIIFVHICSKSHAEKLLCLFPFFFCFINWKKKSFPAPASFILPFPFMMSPKPMTGSQHLTWRDASALWAGCWDEAQLAHFIPKTSATSKQSCALVWTDHRSKHPFCIPGGSPRRILSAVLSWMISHYFQCFIFMHYLCFWSFHHFTLTFLHHFYMYLKIYATHFVSSVLPLLCIYKWGKTRNLRI